MQFLFSIFLFLSPLFSFTQIIDSLNTAKNCTYMSADEKEMVYEINCLRSNPRSYLQYLSPLLDEAKQQLKINGKGQRNYSLTFRTKSSQGENAGSVDTTWYYENEEAIKAITTLISDLKKIKKLSVLQPDSGIYKAAKKHAADQNSHGWALMHTGSDGSQPEDRIQLFSPTMVSSGENIAGRWGYASSTPRDIILDLLIDNRVPGYGHRHNLLDPNWTHTACKKEKYKGDQDWWVQDFGMQREK